MATTRRGYVFGTFLSSCGALVLLIVACVTNVWISSNVLNATVTSGLASKANYGLFSGTYERRVTATNVLPSDIYLVCDFGENICAWSCHSTSEERKTELSELLNGVGSVTSSCSDSAAAQSVTRQLSSNVSSINTRARDKGLFMNAGLYLSTVVFLMLALLATAAATLLAVVNSASNPSRTWLAIDSLYYVNGAAACLDLLVLILWGSHFASVLKVSIGLNDVIIGTYTSGGLANLGWSYWMVLIACIISLGNIGILFWRDYMIKKEPPPPTYNPKEAQDGTLILY